MGQQDLSFRVDRVGVPVLVKVSYFPNWEVDGAEGPFRVAPNLMVVVPTDNEVRLHYGRSGSELFFYVLTLVGIGLLVFFRLRGDEQFDDLMRPARRGGDGRHVFARRRRVHGRRCRARCAPAHWPTRYGTATKSIAS